jgi:hypothetical protein
MKAATLSFASLRGLFVAALLALVAALVSPAAFADTASSDGSAKPIMSANGDFAKGATDAVNQVETVIGNIIPKAVSASAGVMTEANKFAWGLGLISLVLVGVRFSGTHHPISAWVNLFEELAILGIFVALYLGYSTSASGFWTWFQQLAADIGGTQDGSIGSQMATLAGTIFDGIKNRIFSYKTLVDFNGTLLDVVSLAIAFIVMCVAAIVFTYFTCVGQIQAAVGLVIGPIAIALGFSSYTRHYFQKWLDWMIHAGMYVVITAVMVKLLGTNIASAVQKANDLGAQTTMTGAYVLDLAIFILLLSFEIPKLAGIFGGGASATGTGALKLAKGFF